MITFVRTVSAMPGKNAELLAFSHKLKAYFKDKYNLDMGLSMPIGSPSAATAPQAACKIFPMPNSRSTFFTRFDQRCRATSRSRDSWSVQ